MVKCYCDLCEKELINSDGRERYALPIATAENDHNLVNISGLNLCNECKNKIWGTIASLTSMYNYEKLRKVASELYGDTGW